MTETITDETVRANYLRGHRNGYLDYVAGHDRPLESGLTSPIPGYASGYYDGWHGRPPNAPAGTGTGRGTP